MMEIKRIRLNKNRGWRGLAELICEDSERNIVARSIFSFSQDIWDDLLHGCIVIQIEDNYIILNFDNLDKLPRPTQQRSVLIKDFTATVTDIHEYNKHEWNSKAEPTHWVNINHFLKNRNNHTTSSWNCIGVRVVPMI